LLIFDVRIAYRDIKNQQSYDLNLKSKKLDFSLI